MRRGGRLTVNKAQKPGLFSKTLDDKLRRLGQMLCSLLVLILATRVSATDFSNEGLLNRRARVEAAVRSIPFNRLPAPAAEAIHDVTNNPSFYRQIPPRVFQCDPQLMTFMVRHPEVMVNIWEMIGITNITTIRTGQRTFFADDGAGTKCNCELIYSDDELHIYYGTGDYEGLLTPRPVKGRVVCVLRAQQQATPSKGADPLVSSQMDVFLKVDNLGADLLTRTLAPLVGKVTEHNFEETSRFVCQLSEFCANHPIAAQRLTEQLTVTDESIRQEFESIVTQIAFKRSQALGVQLGHPPVHVNISKRSDETEAAPIQASIGKIQLAALPEISAHGLNDSSTDELPLYLTNGEPVRIPRPIQPRKSNLELRR